MSDLAERAISGNDEQAFTDLRKLAACDVVLSTGDSGDNAAAQADKSVFQKTVEYAVGRGEMAADEAVDALIDRQACVFSTFVHKVIEKAVNMSCIAVGGYIGQYFGPQGIATGIKVGAKVAGILNTNLSPLIDKGIDKIKTVAKSVYEKGKAWLKAGAEQLLDNLFN